MASHLHNVIHSTHPEAEEDELDEELNLVAQQSIKNGTIAARDLQVEGDEARRTQSQQLAEALAQLEKEPADEAASGLLFGEDGSASGKKKKKRKAAGAGPSGRKKSKKKA